MNFWFWIPVAVLVLLLVVAYYKRVKILKKIDQMPNSNHLVVLSDTNFKRFVKTGVVLVDFWAPWCMPCKIQGPIINQLADKHHEIATIAKLNIDENQKTAAELGIRSIPTIIIFKNGKPAKKLVGAKQLNVLEKALKEVLQNQ